MKNKHEETTSNENPFVWTKERREAFFRGLKDVPISRSGKWAKMITTRYINAADSPPPKDET